MLDNSLYENNMGVIKMKTKLTFMPYAQATVHHDERGITLRSYRTDVANIDNDHWLTVTGLYSMTTRKHIGAFLKEYTDHNFAMAKWLVENRMKINLLTGEVVEL